MRKRWTAAWPAKPLQGQPELNLGRAARHLVVVTKLSQERIRELGDDLPGWNVRPEHDRQAVTPVLPMKFV
jgi:hypothetical protein